jgi:hypothetical protein
VKYEVFAGGWLLGRLYWGRPVDVLAMPDGALLLSDDYAGAIYRISYERQAVGSQARNSSARDRNRSPYPDSPPGTHQSSFHRLDSVSGGTCLGFCGPVPACNRQHKKQHRAVQETRVGNGSPAGSTQEGRIYVKRRREPKDYCEDSAN